MLHFVDLDESFAIFNYHMILIVFRCRALDSVWTDFYSIASITFYQYVPTARPIDRHTATRSKYTNQTIINNNKRTITQNYIAQLIHLQWQFTLFISIWLSLSSFSNLLSMHFHSKWNKQINLDRWCIFQQNVSNTNQYLQYFQYLTQYFRQLCSIDTAKFLSIENSIKPFAHILHTNTTLAFTVGWSIEQKHSFNGNQ